MTGQELVLKEITLEEFRQKICDERCIVTNKLLDEGHAIEMCYDCPMNLMYEKRAKRNDK